MEDERYCTLIIDFVRTTVFASVWSNLYKVCFISIWDMQRFVFFLILPCPGCWRWPAVQERKHQHAHLVNHPRPPFWNYEHSRATQTKGYNATHQTTSKMLLIRIISSKLYSFILLQSSCFSISNSLTESQLFKYHYPINSAISA